MNKIVEKKPYPCDQDCGILIETRRLISELRKSYTIPDICRQYDLPAAWLNKFNTQKDYVPSVNRVVNLYEILTGTKLIK